MCMDVEVKFAQRKEVVARKEHQCEWCPDPIVRGEKYMFMSMLYDGSFMIEKTHLDCEKVMQEHLNQLYKEGGIDAVDFVDHSFQRGSLERVVPHFERAMGDCLCEKCGLPYNKHPDHRYLYWLTALCDGTFVKL